MPSSVKEMLAEASAAVPRLDPAEVRNRMNRGDVLIVDVRDALELASGGKLKGAVHVSRGMLEFRADPESPYYIPAFQRDQDGPGLLRLRRSLGAERQDPEGLRLPVSLQRRRLQGAGRRRRGDGAGSWPLNLTLARAPHSPRLPSLAGRGLG